MLEIGDLVLCTVDRIIGTVVFVRIDGEEREGNITLSEIAPGRIRNLREYVIPKKRIVCKILRLSNDRVDLSLRRVTQKEKKEVLEQFKQEKSYHDILKSILGNKAEGTINEITKKETIYNFLKESKKNPKNLEKAVGKENAKKILEIINTQKIKKFIIKKEINLTTSQPNGLELIKRLLEKVKDAQINYICAGRYSIKTEAEDIKKADNKSKEIVKEIESDAKRQKMEFSIKNR